MTRQEEKMVLERENARLKEDNEKLGKRICEANQRLDSQWKKVEAALTQNLMMEQELREVRQQLKHAYAAIQLYKAGLGVLQEASYEANKVKEPR